MLIRSLKPAAMFKTWWLVQTFLRGLMTSLLSELLLFLSQEILYAIYSMWLLDQYVTEYMLYPVISYTSASFLAPHKWRQKLPVTILPQATPERAKTVTLPSVWLKREVCEVEGSKLISQWNWNQPQGEPSGSGVSPSAFLLQFSGFYQTRLGTCRSIGSNGFDLCGHVCFSSAHFTWLIHQI